MISVIIPTYNRLPKLKKTLESFREQTFDRKDFEVIVVDDGGNDGTKEYVQEIIPASDFDLRYFSIEHRGPEAARNKGIEESRGDIIFFCGDDTRPEKNLLKIHESHHEAQKGIAVLGITLWDENEEVTDFMRYLAPSGPQFHYNTIKNKNSAGFDHFYTSNISLGGKWLEKEKFDEKFRYAFEDIDLGLRLQENGLRIVFDREAKVFHSHYCDEESFGSRMERVGRSAIIFFDKYKDDKKTLHILRRKYAPFFFFPGIKIFHQISKVLAESKLVKIINIKYHWFWQICFHYTKGMIQELNQKET